MLPFNLTVPQFAESADNNEQPGGAHVHSEDSTPLVGREELEGKDDGGEFVEENEHYTTPDPDNEPNDSGMLNNFTCYSYLIVLKQPVISWRS